MRSADFRTGLTRVAAFGRHFRLPYGMLASMERPYTRGWRLLAGGAVIVTLLLMAAWYAGRESAGLEAERVSTELNQLSNQVAATHLALAQQKAKTDQLENALKGSNQTATMALQSQLYQQLLRSQAEANQYKAIVERERQASTDSARIFDALTTPHARLLPLKGVDAAAESTAYALIVENLRLLFIASNLPQPADGRQFQLWLVRKQDPKFVSLGVFRPDESNQVLMSFDDASVLSDIALVEVTDEPEGGSSVPTGTKLLEAGNGTVEPARGSDEPKV